MIIANYMDYEQSRKIRIVNIYQEIQSIMQFMLTFHTLPPDFSKACSDIKAELLILRGNVAAGEQKPWHSHIHAMQDIAALQVQQSFMWVLIAAKLFEVTIQPTWTEYPDADQVCDQVMTVFWLFRHASNTQVRVYDAAIATFKDLRAIYTGRPSTHTQKMMMEIHKAQPHQASIGDGKSKRIQLSPVKLNYIWDTLNRTSGYLLISIKIWMHNQLDQSDDTITQAFKRVSSVFLDSIPTSPPSSFKD
jgi:hypothetical protein